MVSLVRDEFALESAELATGYSVVTVHDYRLVPETECVYFRVNLMKKVDETSTQRDRMFII